LITGTQVGTVSVGPYNVAPNTTNQYQADSVLLVSGANTITIPSWAFACVINFSTSNTIAVTLKGIAADTGVLLDRNGTSLIDLDEPSPGSSFVLSAASNLTYYTQIIWF
jgi:hypothetical protein